MNTTDYLLQKTEFLHQLADMLGIFIKNIPLKFAKAISIRIEDKKDNHIYIICIDKSQIDTTQELNVILSHELGHFYTDSFYSPNSCIDIIRKMEFKANKFAVHLLIPYQQLVDAIYKKRIFTVYELAKYFNVTEEFLKLAIHIYRLADKDLMLA